MSERKSVKEKPSVLRAVAGVTRRPLVRDLLIVLAFFALTALMTWPWVTRMRDAVADEGDPYMIAWSLWWDYHQTFTNPLNLFHANIFYPYKYTLAFSEHEYGVALLFFPLFALGLRALTVQSFATFCGFAFSGYGAFRLTRTLTRSSGPARIAGIIFAFIPYRFHLLSHLHYLFAGWIPLLLEALVLFARKRSWRRAAWLGVAFAMNALTCTSYFILTLVPLALSGAFLILNYSIERDRALWFRGATALGLASIVLLPFMLPYYFVMKLYGFVRSVDDVAYNSPTPVHWLVAERRNKLWSGLGAGIPNATARLFPGLLPLLLSLAAFFAAPKEANDNDADAHEGGVSRKKLLLALDALILLTLIITLLVTGYQGTTASVFGIDILNVLTPPRVGFVVLTVVVFRLAVAYPKSFRWTRQKNLIESIRHARRGDAFALGLIWTICGFLGSLGMNFFLNRVLYDFVPLFHAIRIPSHWAMISYLGLAILAGLGTQHLAERFSAWRPRTRQALVFAVIAAALLFELRAAPLGFARGKVYPDEITLRLKQTPMRGGLVELPHDLGLATPHLYMLRAADHGKPLVNATSSFVSPLSWEVQAMSDSRPISLKFLDLLESIPASYVVIHNSALAPERRLEYEIFLSQAMANNRLRFINSFGNRDDLYAVVKTEPQAESEAPVPFKTDVKEWSQLIADDPINLLGRYRSTSQALYRFFAVSYGRMPLYSEFLPDIERVGKGVMIGASEEEAKLEANLDEFARTWTHRERFETLYRATDNTRYVEALANNAGLALTAPERAIWAEKLNNGSMTRAQVLREIVNSSDFIRREEVRSLVLLHYFGYLRRNPEDPPDNDMKGFNHWVKELETSGDNARLARVFMSSFEYEGLQKKLGRVQK